MNIKTFINQINLLNKNSRIISSLSPEDNERAALQSFENGDTVLHHTPSLITLESTAVCNLRCIMCPQSINAVNRPSHMPNKYIEKFSVFLSRTREIQLHGIGEPLISPFFWKILETLPSNCNTSMNSNFTLLDDKKIKRLLDSNISSINVSLDAAFNKTYRFIRGCDLDTPLNNVRKILNLRNEKKEYATQIYINMTLMKANINELKPFIELASDLGVDGVRLGHLNPWPLEQKKRYNRTVDNILFSYKDQELCTSPDLSNLNVSTAVDKAKELGVALHPDQVKDLFFNDSTLSGEKSISHEVRECQYPWKWLMITSDGKVRPCCYAKTVGSIKWNSLEHIWNNRNMSQLRHFINNNRIHAVCSKAACKYVNGREL